MSAFPYFYGLKAGYFRKHFYKVFVANGMLCKARIAGIYFNKEIVKSLHRHSPAKYLEPLFRRSVKKRYETEEKYELIQPSSIQFLEQSKHNSQLSLGDIERITFTSGRSIWAAHVSNCGKMNIYLKNGYKESLVLIDNHASDVASILETVLPSVEIMIDSKLQHHIHVE